MKSNLPKNIYISTDGFGNNKMVVPKTSMVETQHTGPKFIRWRKPTPHDEESLKQHEADLYNCNSATVNSRHNRQIINRKPARWLSQSKQKEPNVAQQVFNGVALSPKNVTKLFTFSCKISQLEPIKEINYDLKSEWSGNGKSKLLKEHLRFQKEFLKCGGV